MFIWTLPCIITALTRHAPDLAHFVTEVHERGDLDAVLEEKFRHLHISIDYAVMEKASRVMMLEASFDWDDVGTWTAAAKYFNRDPHGNAANAELSVLGAENNIVFTGAGKRVALLGVNNLIVIESDDALLVCHARDAERASNNSCAKFRRNCNEPHPRRRSRGGAHRVGRFGRVGMHGPSAGNARRAQRKARG